MANDTYTVFSESQSKRLKKCVDAALMREDNELDVVVDREFGLAIHRSAFESIINGARHAYSGVWATCWSIQQRDLSFSANRLAIARALATLHTVHRCAGKNRMLGLKLMIERAKQMRRPRTSLSLDAVIKSLNAACMLYLKETKCLEWVTTLILLGSRYGHDLNLVVGVQNRPFYAHAWAELNCEVVGDEFTLRNQLAVILEIN